MTAELTELIADPALYSRHDPHQLFRWLREHDPVRWHAIDGSSRGYWIVTRYPDVERVLRDHVVFTSEKGTLLNLLGCGDPAAGKQLAATDPPRHDTLRIPLQRALAMGPVETHADAIQEGIRELLAPMTSGEPFDFAEAMARLPLIPLGLILDLPPEDHTRLIRLAVMSTAEEDPEFQLPGGERPTLARAHRQLFAYFSDLVRLRTRAPGDDLISLLATVEIDGERMSPGSVISNCYSMLLGSAGTLPHVATAAVLELATNGGYADWAESPELLESGVEEALRWATPASNFMRYTRQDTELSGVKIPMGDAVVAYLGSANRDGAVFKNADVFDVRRRPNRHLAFGVGHHYCVGSHLARLTLRILFKELFTLCSDITIAAEPERFHSRFLAGYKRMPVVGHARP